MKVIKYVEKLEKIWFRFFISSLYRGSKCANMTLLNAQYIKYKWNTKHSMRKMVEISYNR